MIAEFLKWVWRDVRCAVKGHKFRYSGKWTDNEFYVCLRCEQEFMKFRHMMIPIPSYEEAIEVLRRYESEPE